MAAAQGCKGNTTQINPGANICQQPGSGAAFSPGLCLVFLAWLMHPGNSPAATKAQQEKNLVTLLFIFYFFIPSCPSTFLQLRTRGSSSSSSVFTALGVHSWLGGWGKNKAIFLPNSMSSRCNFIISSTSLSMWEDLAANQPGLFVTSLIPWAGNNPGAFNWFGI